MLPSQSASDLRGVSAAERILRHFVADPDVNVLAPSHIIMQPFMPFMPISPLRHFDDFFGAFVGNLVGNLVGNSERPSDCLVTVTWWPFWLPEPLLGSSKELWPVPCWVSWSGRSRRGHASENVARNPSARSGLGFFPSPFHSLGCGGF